MTQKDISSTIKFDKMCVTYYANKLLSCKARGIEFNLTYTQVKNMLRAKRCQYTGITLTKSSGAKQLPTDVTIERIDSSKPYETGNVCAVSYAANMAMNNMEQWFGKNSINAMKKMTKYVSKHNAKSK